MPEVHVGALDPIGAFQQQISDLIQITEAFEKHDKLKALDYLRAAHIVRENLNAIVHIVMSSIMSDVIGTERVGPDDFAAHTAEMDADERSPEERMAAVLMRISKNLTIDTDDLPEGFPPNFPGTGGGD